MTPDAAASAITGRRVLLIAVPVVVSNASVPLQGAVDTAIVGNLERAAALGGVGLGAELFSLLLVSFNFLKIGTSGLSAQALGARDPARVLNTLARALLLGLGLGLAMIALQAPALSAGLAFFGAGAETESAAAAYFRIRIWGAPLELANFALLGWFTGQEMTGALFRHQLSITLSNIALSVVLAVGLEMGLEGVALATVLGNLVGLAYGLRRAVLRRTALAPHWRPQAARLLQGAELRKLMSLNRDLFIRTLLLVGAIAWMMRLGAQLGESTLAANVVLWQFFIFAAHGLDGFAMASETLVGQAIGARDRMALRRAALISALWSGGLAMAATLTLWLGAGALIDLMTDLPAVRQEARAYALWAVLIPLTGFAAFQLDGIFFGAAAGAALRNAMILAALVYVPASLALMQGFGNHGVWAAMHLFLVLRAAALLWRYPALERAVADEAGAAQRADGRFRRGGGKRP